MTGLHAVAPVCPACRSAIALDAVTCGRCGLAVRPTCPVCGEALSVGMEACLGCGRPLERPYPAPLAAEPPRADEPVSAAAEQRSRPVRRREWVHVLVVGIAAGIIVAGGLLALELVGPERLLVRDDELNERSFPGLSFALSHPVEWTVEPGTVGGLEAVTFTATDPRGRRGFRVIAETVPLERVRDEVEDLFANRRSGYRKLAITDGIELAGRPALRHLFIDGELSFEQWWVARVGGTYRIEFWSPIGEREAANVENARILETFRLT